MTRPPFRAPPDFVVDEDGTFTMWSLCWVLFVLAVGGIGVDTANAWRTRAMLQSTSDAAAFAGAIAMADPRRALRGLDNHAIVRELDPTNPIEVARAVAEINLAPERHGVVVPEDAVEIGRWNEDDRKFVKNAGPPDAIRVLALRAGVNDNALGTYLLRLFGVVDFDLATVSVARIKRLPRGECHEPVLTVQTRVDVQENDIYLGVCVHADVDVDAETTDRWLTDEAAALIDRVMFATAGATLDDTGEVVGGILGGTPPGDVLSDLLRPLTKNDVRQLAADLRASADVVVESDLINFANLTAGATYYIECEDDQTLYLPGGISVSQVTLLSECPVRVEQDVSLTSTILISNLEGFLRDLSLSVAPPTGLYIASRDPCLPGDGLRIAVYLNAATTAKLKMFDTELFPLGQVLADVQREQSEVEGSTILSLNATVVGEILANAGATELLDVCFGAQYMLHADLFALSQ